MSIFEKVQAIDKRILYWILFILLMVPFLNPIGLPIRIMPYTKGIYDEMLLLQPGDVVILSINGGVSAWPEILPAMVACVRQVVIQDVNLIVWGFGHVDIDLTWDKIKSMVPEIEEKWTYGEDYAYFGYLPTQETTLALLANNIRGVFSLDRYGDPIESLPIMENVNSYEDVRFLLTSDTGEVGTQYVRQWGSAYGVKMATIGIAMGASNIVYYHSGEIVGMSIGSRGGAELEKMTGVLGNATVTMDSINVSHILLVLVVILTNVGYFATRGKK